MILLVFLCGAGSRQLWCAYLKNGRLSLPVWSWESLVD